MNDDQRKQFNSQMNLQQIATEKRNIMLDIVAKAMAETYFPEDKLIPGFAEIAEKAIYHALPIANRIPLKDQVAAMKAIRENPVKISLAHFKTLADSFDAIAPVNTFLDYDAYISFIDQLFEMVAVWEKMLTKIRDEATIKAEAEYNMKQKMLEDQNKDKNNGILKPIKGEA